MVLALLAGLVAMHVLSGTVLAGDAQESTMADAMSGDVGGGTAAHGGVPVSPASDAPHDGPVATGHDRCLVALTDGVGLAAPADLGVVTPPLLLSLPRSVPTRAHSERAPPDLNDLCISRT